MDFVYGVVAFLLRTVYRNNFSERAMQLRLVVEIWSLESRVSDRATYRRMYARDLYQDQEYIYHYDYLLGRRRNIEGQGYGIDRMLKAEIAKHKTPTCVRYRETISPPAGR